MGRNRRAKGEQQPEGDARPETPQRQSVAEAILVGAVSALFVLRPLYPSESVAAEGDGLPVVMLWLLTLTFWAILVARRTVRQVRFGRPDAALAALVVWHSIAALWAFAHESPRPALNMLWEWLGLAVAFFLARQVFSSGLQRRAIGAVVAALAVAVSIYGLYQYGIELPATRDLYEQSSDARLRELGLWFPVGSPERMQFEQRLASLEPMATFALANSLAGFLVPWAVVALGISIAFAPRLSLRQKVVIALLLIPLGLCLLLTKSRSAFLAVACGVAATAAVWWFGRHRQMQMRRIMLVATLAVTLVGAAVLGAVMVGGLDVEVLSEAPKSLGYRLQYWQASVAMIRDMPLLGCGPGNFQNRYTAYKLPDASEEIADPHNFLLEVWATAGTPAAIALVATIGAFCLCVLRPSQRTAEGSVETPEYRVLQSPDLAAILGGAVVGVLLSLPISVFSAAPPNWWVLLAVLPVGAAVLMTLVPWIARGHESAALWTLAASALLVHLLFAGGIAFPGVAGSLWLLAALALNASQCGEREVRAGVGTAVVAVTLALLVACHVTGYLPTLVARSRLGQAYSPNVDPEPLLREAAAADPWAIEPRKLLADLAYQRWVLQPGDENLARFDHAVSETLSRAPRGATLRHQFGREYCEGYRLCQNQALLERAVQLLESDTALYPNSCQIRADLAESYLLAGDRAGYERERDEAFRLEKLTPHLDKRLSKEQRQRLSRTVLAPEVRAVPPE